MKKYLVSFANKDFYGKQKILNKTSSQFGIDETISYNDKMLKETEFYKRNKELLNQKRGAGYWIWKPYIINEAMKKLNNGDILFYVDSGAEIISNINPLIELCIEQDGILLFNGIHKNKFWTKRDCFIKMKCDYEKYWEGSQTITGYQIYIKNEKSINFLKELLHFSKIKDIMNDSPSIEPNKEGFIEHRHDQSVLSNLVIKYNLKTFRNPSQGGNHLKHPNIREDGEWLMYPYTYSEGYDKESMYPTIFFNKRNAGLFKLFLIKLHSKFPIKLKLLLGNKR